MADMTMLIAQGWGNSLEFLAEVTEHLMKDTIKEKILILATV